MTPGICCIIMHDGAGRWGCGGSDVAMGVRDGGERGWVPGTWRSRCSFVCKICHNNNNIKKNHLGNF